MFSDRLTVFIALAGLGLLGGCVGSSPGPDLGTTSFGDFTPPANRAHVLICPHNYCLAPADATSTALKAGAGPMQPVLRRVLDAAAAAPPAAITNEGMRLTYRVPSRVPGEAVELVVELVDLNEDSCSYVLYAETQGPLDIGAAAAAAADFRRRIDAIEPLRRDPGPPITP